MAPLEADGDEAARRLCDGLATGLRAAPDVRLAWLYGSRARGTARADSDVDVAVLVDDACTADSTALKNTHFRLVPTLTGAVRSDRLHLVILNHAPPLLRHRVIRDGIVHRAIRDDLGDLDAVRRWAVGKLDDALGNAPGA